MQRDRGNRTRRPEPKRPPVAALVSIGLAAALATGACTGDGSSVPTPSGGRSKRIPQPVVENPALAPESERVDLTVPTFSDPTNVTNALFPISKQESVLLLGKVEGKPFRTEVTLLPYTRIIEWEGQRVETLVSQYLAYLDGRIQEIAYDFYAQSDDGSVWYFGEDVADFKDGAIVTTQGTWLAGKDGPAAMIMPADPKVGNVYRTENIPGMAFEEVTVRSVDETLDGPLGPIDGGVIGEELHFTGGQTEEKIFAPGYGEFYTAAEGDVEALALAVPTDAASGPPPRELVTLETGATGVFESAQSEDWNAASATVKEMVAAWDTFRAGEVPKLIEPRMTGTLDSLVAAVADRNIARASQASIDAAQWSLDLQLRHRPPSQIDLARFDLWAAQLLIDVAANDAGAVNGDSFSLDYIRDRILHALGDADVDRINVQLEELQNAVADEDFATAVDAAAQLRDTVTGLEPVS